MEVLQLILLVLDSAAIYRTLVLTHTHKMYEWRQLIN